MYQATPTVFQPGEWHLPYVTEDSLDLETAQKCSVARCARVSYLTHDKAQPDVEKDMRLFKFLFDSMHLTPFEHQATPMELEANYSFENGSEPEYASDWELGITHISRDGKYFSANFAGWVQHRQLLSEWNG
jgi:hypothetical protein